MVMTQETSDLLVMLATFLVAFTGLGLGLGVIVAVIREGFGGGDSDA
jgi:hypothetical protein